jgi:hypothetical protein
MSPLPPEAAELLAARHELLDRTLIWNQTHLLHALSEFESYYNQHRHHRTLHSAPLRPAPKPLTDLDRLNQFDIRRRDRLGGILYEYQHNAPHTTTSPPTPARPLTPRTEITMLDDSTRWSLPRGNPLVPSRWQATACWSASPSPAPRARGEGSSEALQRGKGARLHFQDGTAPPGWDAPTVPGTT